ncbi:MAG: VCBS repeat-containing protein [Myxococcota bacterium]|nr:VCBS repeat-containing protein [Myxococcota bacterium]
MRTPNPLVFAALILNACGGEDANSDPTPFSVIEARSAVDLAIGPAMGAEEVFVPVRGVNAYGAAVPNVSFQLAVEGNAVNNNGLAIETGAWGIAEVRLWSAVPQHIRITAPDWEADEPPSGDAWLLTEQFAPRSLSDAQALRGRPGQVSSGNGATLYSVGETIYWQQHSPGAAPQVSAVLSSEVLGTLSVNLDGDGYTDYAVWSADEVLLLRGSTLGPVWGDGFALNSGRIVDVAVDNLDQDRNPDVAVAYVDGSTYGLQAYINGGSWSFEALPLLGLGAEPTSLGIGNYLGSSESEVAILQGSSIVRYRFDSVEERWLNSGQDLKPEPGFGPGAQLGVSEDISGDSSEELFIIEAPVESGERRFAFYELPFERPLIYDLGFEAHEYLLADATGDGIPDAIVLQQDGAGRAELRALTSDSAGEDPYRNRGFSTLAQVGKLGAEDANNDGVTDITVVNEAILHYQGRIPEDGFWAVADPGIGGWDMNAQSPAWIIDANGDGKKKDLLIIRDTAGKTGLWSYTFSGGTNGNDLVFVKAPTYERNLDGKDANNRASFLDWDICDEGDSYIYMLVNDGGSWLFVTKIQTNGSVPGRADVAVRADKVTCGPFANGASIAAVSYAGEVNYFDNALQPIATETIDPMNDVVGANLEGTGTELVSCEEVGCTLVAGDLDGDGIDELVRGGPSPTLTAWGTTWELGSTGIPSLSDVDGNGTLDVVLTSPDSGHVEVHLVLGQSLAPAQAFHTRQLLGGSAAAGDVDNDGFAEFFLLSSTGDLLFASQD